jgi:pullulanase/glycogen debranching enzyme
MAFTAQLVQARLACPALTGGRKLTGQPIDASQIPDVAWLLADGRALTPDDWQNHDNHTLVAALYAPDSRAAIVLHAGHIATEVSLRCRCPTRVRASAGTVLSTVPSFRPTSSPSRHARWCCSSRSRTAASA